MITVSQTNKLFRKSCAIGLLLSVYALFVEMKKEANEDYEALCDINEHISCSKVFSSRYGRGFGLINTIFGEDSIMNQPNSVAGIIFYVLLLILNLSKKRKVLKLQLCFCIVANFVSVYLGYILYFILHDFCVVCVSTYIINALNLALCILKWNLTDTLSGTHINSKSKSKREDINFDVIPDFAKYLHANGIEGILVNGTSGEGVSLTVKEREDVLEAWMKAARLYNQTVMVQVGGTNIKDVKRLAKHAEKCKVSSILCLADLFFRPTNVNDLIHYLKLVSAEAPHTPLLYYHIPSFTGINVNMKELLERSSEVPTLRGIKFTDSDLVQGASCVSSNPAQAVFLGCDSLFLSALFLGFDSAISTTINVFPQSSCKILRYFKEKKFEKAATEQHNLNHNIQQIIRHGSWVSSMKAAMRILTPIEVGPVREPLLNVSLENVGLNLL